MKSLLLILLFSLSNLIYSQNTENISKIELLYTFGGSLWGKSGIYSRSEFIELTKIENGDFKFSRQIKISEKVNSKRVFSKDSTEINTSNFKIISKNEIENLLKSLNTNEENFTEEFLKQNFLKPTKKEIFKIAKQNNFKNYFKNNYDEKSDTEKKYSEIQDFKYFKEFLNKNKPNRDEYILTMDVWNNLSIITYSQQETKLYDFSLFYNCGQPINSSLIEINKTTKAVNTLENTRTSIINLNANLIIQKIIPEDSKLWKEIDLNNIKRKYISWFLENKITEFVY